MKFTRLFALVLVSLLAFSCAVAEGVDWASMDDNVINAEIDRAKAELTRRELVGNVENAVVFDENGFTVTFKDYEMGDFYRFDAPLHISCTAVNTSDFDFDVHIENVAVNGWEVDYSGGFEVAAGHKEKANMWLKLEDAEISTYEEIETIEISFRYRDADDKRHQTEPVTINFK